MCSLVWNYGSVSVNSWANIFESWLELTVPFVCKCSARFQLHGFFAMVH